MFERIRELVDKLNLYNYHYYTLDEPLVVDAVYDKLYSELVELENKYKFNFLDSPTTRVGGELLSEFEKYEHERPLWSLQKSQSEDELRAWIERVSKLVDEYNINHSEKLPSLEFVVEYKFDGLTCNLTYENGFLKVAATRGNGIVGENITKQARTIKNIPSSIGYLGHIEIQGEAYMPLSELERYNRNAEIKLKNARNAAAGALRNLDTSETGKRNLRIFTYNIGYVDGIEFKTHMESLQFLEQEKFPVNSFHPIVRNFEEMMDKISYIKEERHKLDYLTDGVVIKINDLKTREVLGYTNKFPRWAIAFKFEAEEVETKILGVTWNVGRTGKVTPVANLEAVEISGATVTNATLNNIDDIRRKGVKIGANVIVRRSNEVIPEIMGTIGDLSGTSEVEIPEYCPSCGSKLVMDGAYLVCKNYALCKPQIVNRIVHFASRNAMDIEGLNEKTAESLVNNLGVKDVSDIYRLKLDDILSLPRFAEKSASNLYEAIVKSKTRELHRFIFALGIFEVGIKSAHDLAEKFKTFDNFRKASYEDLISVDGVGDVIANNILNFFKGQEVNELIDDLLANGVNTLEHVDEKGEGYFTGLRVVITGSFENYKRNDLKKIIMDQGGKDSSSVSKNTDIVLVGSDPGSKYDKAVELGIKIMNEKELREVLDE